MRAFRSKLLAFFLLAVVVTFNTGMGFVEHSCLAEDEITISLQKKSCCSNKKSCIHPIQTPQTTLKKAACCEDKTIYVHVDFTGYAQKIGKFFTGAYVTTIQYVTHFIESFLRRAKIVFHYTNSSPPLSGRDILTQNCTLLV